MVPLWGHGQLLRDGVAQEADQAQLRGLLIRLGAQRLLQELLEAEQREFLGAGRLERSESRQGRRNDYEPAHLETAEGRIELEAPQVRDSSQTFQSKLLGFPIQPRRSELLRMPYIVSAATTALIYCFVQQAESE